jgi:hypothetical protein
VLVHRVWAGTVANCLSIGVESALDTGQDHARGPDTGNRVGTCQASSGLSRPRGKLVPRVGAEVSSSSIWTGCRPFRSRGLRFPRRRNASLSGRSQPLAESKCVKKTPLLKRSPFRRLSDRLSALSASGPLSGAKCARQSCPSMSRCFQELEPNQRASLLLVHLVLDVLTIVGEGLTDSHATPGGDRRNSVSRWQTVPLFSPATNTGGTGKQRHNFTAVPSSR